MKDQQQQKEKIHQSDDSRFRSIAIMYLDITIRSLIAFLCIGFLLSLIFIGYFHLSWILVLPIIFVTTIIVSPFLSKIKLGEFVFDYYTNALKKTFKIQ